MNHVRSLADDLGSHSTRRNMHPARKPLATLAITLGIFMVMLGAPALAGADDANTADLDASAIAQTKPSAELAAADDDGDNANGNDGANGTETDGSADADGTAIVGIESVAVDADSVAIESVAVSVESVLGPGGGDNAAADGTDNGGDDADADGTALLGADQGGQNSGQNGENQNSNENGDDSGQGVGSGDNSTDNPGSGTETDGGGEPSPAANDPVLANTGVAPTTAAQGTDRNLPDAGGPASMMVLMSGFGLVLAGVVVLAHGRVRVARHRA
jgi:hypothetical protein